MDPSDMHCSLCPVLPLAPSPFAPVRTPWMDYRCGLSLVLPGAANGPCCQHPACCVPVLGDITLGREGTLYAGVIHGCCLAFPCCCLTCLILQLVAWGILQQNGFLVGNALSEKINLWLRSYDLSWKLTFRSV